MSYKARGNMDNVHYLPALPIEWELGRAVAEGNVSRRASCSKRYGVQQRIQTYGELSQNVAAVSLRVVCCHALCPKTLEIQR
jgi:hypothetical protein